MVQNQKNKSPTAVEGCGENGNNHPDPLSPQALCFDRPAERRHRFGEMRAFSTVSTFRGKRGLRGGWLSSSCSPQQSTLFPEASPDALLIGWVPQAGCLQLFSVHPAPLRPRQQRPVQALARGRSWLTRALRRTGIHCVLRAVQSRSLGVSPHRREALPPTPAAVPASPSAGG